ncbi:MAG: hypothetical protein AB9879_04715 [Methanothrix sp.]
MRIAVTVLKVNAKQAKEYLALKAVVVDLAILEYTPMKFTKSDEVQLQKFIETTHIKSYSFFTRFDID